jgi:hypothetical protein
LNHDPTLSPPWTVEPIPGGFVVKDANGQSLAHVYADSRQDGLSHMSSWNNGYTWSRKPIGRFG